jgi:hypothetical protein
MEGMVNLAFVLLGAKAARGKETVAEKLRGFGMFVLVRLVKKHNEATGPVLRRLTDCIIAGQAVTQYTGGYQNTAPSFCIYRNRNTALNFVKFRGPASSLPFSYRYCREC